MIADYNANKSTSVSVTGHTDRAGSDAYNEKLSERRADAVREALIAGGALVDLTEPQYNLTAMQIALFNGHYRFAKLLIDKGAAWVDTPKAVAEKSDVVFAIVGFPKDVRAVFLGADGALAGSKPGNVLVDMTTSEPSLAREIAVAAKAKNVASVDGGPWELTVVRL